MECGRATALRLTCILVVVAYSDGATSRHLKDVAFLGRNATVRQERSNAMATRRRLEAPKWQDDPKARVEENIRISNEAAKAQFFKRQANQHKRRAGKMGGKARPERIKREAELKRNPPPPPTPPPSISKNWTSKPAIAALLSWDVLVDSVDDDR